MEKYGLYIHIPFCVKKCLYCDFCSFPNINSKTVEEYCVALCKEIRMTSAKYADVVFNTIFIGGGTPTFLNTNQLESIMKSVYDSYNIDRDSEISCEGNPGTFDSYKLDSMLKSGINRLSVGVQSTNDELLKRIGRIHTAQQGIESIKNAKKVGFKNINVDLMYGLPEQSLEEHINSLKEIASLDIQHISSYNLILEEKTMLNKMYEAGKISIPNEEIQLDMYHKTVDTLELFGFNQYEISNYCLNNYECKHNIKYWSRVPYLGFGLAAHSFIKQENNALRYSNTSNIKKYINDINESKFPISQKNILSLQEEKFETLMLGFRMLKGISEIDFVKEFNQDIDTAFNGKIEMLIKAKLLKRNNEFLSMTPRGIEIQNAVLVKLME